MSRKRRQAADADADADTAHSPTPAQVYRAARAYVRAGLSLIPIRADGTKMPAFELLPRVWSEESGKYRRPWGGYRLRRPTPAELRSWFGVGLVEYGMAILAGAVSGNLEILDLDNWGVVEPWTKLVEQRAPGLLDRLVRVRTPRPGLHVYYRCEVIGGNQKLAREPDPEKDNQKPRTIIEVKGEGGYCLAPPSPAACHKSGRSYAFLAGKDLSQVPTITKDEREILIRCARELDRWKDPRGQGYVRRRPVVHGQFQRPGDDYNARAEWADILTPHGWRWAGTGGDGSDLWCRPGKTHGTSATTNFANRDLLYVFSTNADPFEEQTGYTKFCAFALLNHDGDFTAAARALAADGFGQCGRLASAATPSPYRRYSTYTTTHLRKKRKK
jgi:putative DNA primase/helicase